MVVRDREDCERRYETTVGRVQAQEDVCARRGPGDEALRGPEEFARFLEDDAARPEQCGARVALRRAAFSVVSVRGRFAPWSLQGLELDRRLAGKDELVNPLAELEGKFEEGEMGGACQDDCPHAFVWAAGHLGLGRGQQSGSLPEGE